MKIPVYFLSFKPEVPNHGYWDYAMLESILKKELWNTVGGYDYEFDYSNLLEKRHVDFTFGVVVIPARTHIDVVERINKTIAKLQWVLLILMGDEDGAFPTEKLQHPRMKVWLMLPHNGNKKNVSRFFPNGFTPGCREYLSTSYAQKNLGWFFSGQVTHSRRKQCVEGLRKAQTESANESVLLETDGFTKGLDQKKFWNYLNESKVAPCPSGAIVPDSFRFYEALEAGALPLVDGKSPHGAGKNFWHLLFGEDELPFPIIDDWKDIVGTLNYHIDTYPFAANRTFAWWQQQKRKLAYNLKEDIQELNWNNSENMGLRDEITVIIPTSYIKSHPDTSMIEETIRTVRERLPDSEIIVTFDGIRDEQKDGFQDYEEYKRRMLWKFNHEYTNILPILFDKHTHQIGMAREALKHVKTPLILYVEHDAPICEYIPFENLVALVKSKYANLVRLHHEALILPDHKHLMLDQHPITVSDVPIVRTAQWSQRPHLASTEFYNLVLNSYLRPEAFGMIEDGIIGKPASAFFARGEVGWNDWRLVIYAPEGDMKRSYHLDGRGRESKFEETFHYG